MNRLKTPARLMALFVFSLALHLAGTWLLPLIDRDEPRFAEAAREMRARGDWVVPTFNHEPRYDKPPLTYWLQMAAFALFGETEFAARFHAPLCASLTALTIFGFAARLYGKRAAWGAAVAFTLCAQVFVQGKAAVADMPMVLCVTVAAWAGWELCERPRRGWWWMFYIALALGFLAKGPVAFLPVLWVLIYGRAAGIDGLARRFAFARGACVTLLIVAAWGMPALLRTDGEFFKVGIGRHVFARSFAPLEGHGARGWLGYAVLLPFYFVTVFASFFPWSWWLPKMARRLWLGRGKADVYLLGGVLSTFAVFSLIATKLPHYTLPAFPLLACLIAPELAARRSALVAVGSGIAALELCVALIAFPIFGAHLPVKHLVEKIRQELRPKTEIAVAGYFEPSVIWYLRANSAAFPREIPRDDVAAWLRKKGPRVCLWEGELDVTANAQASGINPANGKRVTLSAATAR